MDDAVRPRAAGARRRLAAARVAPHDAPAPWNQFAFPLGLMAVEIVACLVVFPQTKHLSPMFSPKLKLPIALINFGIVAFVFGSIAQEFWRGAPVRKKQTGSDP